MPRIWLRGLYSVIVAVVLAGCGGDETSGPETVDVSGTVTLDGQPLAGADVYFASEKFSGYARTGPDGSYQLVQGAVPGDNRVHFSKLAGGEGIELDPEAGIDQGQLEAMSLADDEGTTRGAATDLPRQLIPDAYSDPQRTKLTYRVPEDGSTTADFRLTSN